MASSNRNTRNYRLPGYRQLFPNLVKQIRPRAWNRFTVTCVTIEREKFQNKYITNLSRTTIPKTQLEILCKGLNFVPTPRNTPHTIDLAISRTTHIYNLHKHFKDSPKINLPEKHPFHVRSNWSPPDNPSEPHPPTAQNFFQSQFFSRQPVKSNLSSTESEDLTTLINNPNLTIKRSDKGGGITIMDTDSYINQVRTEHLSDASTYQPLPFNPIPAIATDTNTLIDFLLCHQHIDSTTAQYLRPPNPVRTPIFYGLPKIHKPNKPLRPIISGFDSPTDNLAKYMTHFLSPLAELLPTHFKDSSDFKRYLNTLPPLPPNAFLVTADIVSLYTNIPIDEGVDHVCDFIDNNRQHLPPNAPNTQVFRLILDHILKHNAFSFLDDHFLQILGTAMGCRMAPPYANLFLFFLDCIISGFPNIRYLKRFIDDLFFIFIGSESTIQRLQDLLNSLHPTIKFTLTYSRTSIDYLDLHIYLDAARKLRTSLYRKPTDCQSYLHYDSHHPKHTKTGIIYSQALRFNRLIDDDTELQKQLHIFTRALLVQNYPLDVINHHISKALAHTQNELLYRQKPPTDQSKFHDSILLPFCQLSTSFNQFISNFNTLPTPSTPSVPRPQIRTLFTRTKNIGDLVTHTKTSIPTPQ